MPNMESDLTVSQIAILRSIGIGHGDSQWVTPFDDDADQAAALVRGRFIQQWDNQYIVTDLGRSVLKKLDANGP